jgi:hypothetical protein
MPRPNPVTNAVQAVFLTALRDGATVVEAAAAAGVGLGTLYRVRRRDPLFDSAWSFAAELSSPWAWDQAAGRMARAAGSRRRLRFGERRSSAFLDALERCCNTQTAAGAAGVNRSTVLRRIHRDPDFARIHGETLRRGIDALLRESEAARARTMERIRSGEFLARLEPKGEITRDSDRQMLLLARYGRPDGTIGPRRVRHGRMRSMPFDEAIRLLDRKLRWLGLVEDLPVAERMKRAANGTSGP